jgi:hypothetical protein
MSSSTSQLVHFYQGIGNDSEGRHLKDIQQWDYEQLEYVHNYIQWLFPLPERSSYNVNAPILKSEDIQKFINSTELRQELLNNLDIMLGFYGFIRYSNKILPAANYQDRIQTWINYGNHNFLRISRILKSLKLLGLAKEADQFFQALEQIYPDNKTEIGNSFQHWQDAISHT